MAVRIAKADRGARRLQSGKVNHWFRWRCQVSILRGSDDTDDDALQAIPGEDVTPERIRVGEKSLCQGSINHGHTNSVLVVFRHKIAPAQKWNPHRFKVTWGDPAQKNDWYRLIGPGDPANNLDVATCEVTRKRHGIVCSGRHDYARQGTDPAQERFLKFQDLIRLTVLRHWQEKLGAQHVICAESRIRVFYVHETS